MSCHSRSCLQSMPSVGAGGLDCTSTGGRASPWRPRTSRAIRRSCTASWNADQTVGGWRAMSSAPARAGRVSGGASVKRILKCPCSRGKQKPRRIAATSSSSSPTDTKPSVSVSMARRYSCAIQRISRRSHEAASLLTWECPSGRLERRSAGDKSPFVGDVGPAVRRSAGDGAPRAAPFMGAVGPASQAIIIMHDAGALDSSIDDIPVGRPKRAAAAGSEGSILGNFSPTFSVNSKSRLGGRVGTQWKSTGKQGRTGKRPQT